MKFLFCLLFSLLLFLSFGQTIVIDAGHGYCSNCTQSCVSNVRTDTEILTAMSVTNKLNALLQNCSNITTHLTRSSSACGDIPSVTQRGIMSNNWGADRFLSIHCNGGGGTGTETFWCDLSASSNSASSNFSTEVQNQMVSYGSWTNRRVVEGRSYLSFHLGVLRNTNAIGCLSEIGFVDNNNDRVKLENNSWRDQFAQAYYVALQNSLNTSCSGSTPPPSPSVLDCSNAISLTCGITYTGSNSSASSIIDSYGCNSWTESGPERIHSIVSDGNGILKANLTNYSGDLDVYILASCDPNDCIGNVYSDSAVITNAVAGTTYYIVVDADDGSGSGYNLTVTCPNSVPPAVLDCQNAIPLTCGVTYSGPSSTAVSNVSSYGCNNWSETGPERVHSIIAQNNGPMTASISNFTGDLDVYILGSCDPNSCIGSVTGSAATYNNAIAGQTYYVVVDADDGSGSAYDLTVYCAGSTPPLCQNAIPITCGVSYTGVNSSAISSVETYGCNTWSESGPERVHMITPLSDGVISAKLSNYSGDLDVYILGSCDPNDCLGIVFSDSAIYANVSANQTYYIVVDSDNGSGSGYNLVVNCQGTSGGNEDLRVSNARTSTNSVEAGGSITAFADQIYNGDLYTSDLNFISMAYYISTDCNLSIDDIHLGGSLSLVGIDAPVSSEMINVTIPVNTSPGNYFILFSADNGQSIFELNEANNISCTPITVTAVGGNSDIELSNSFVNQDSLQPGSSLLINTTQSFTGTQNSNNLPNFELTYYLSLDCNLDVTDVELGNEFTILGADNTLENEVSLVTIPQNTQDGSYYIIVVSDDANALAELDELNNIECLPIYIASTYTSINRDEKSSNVIIYPNPSSGVFYFQAENTTIESVEVYNNIGMKLNNLNIDQNSINIQQFSNGIYFIRIKDNLNHITNYRIIKK